MQGNQLFLDFISLDEIERIEAEMAGQIVLFEQPSFYEIEDLPKQLQPHHPSRSLDS